MEILQGAALLGGCILLLWLVRSRDGQAIPALRSDSAQSAFMMAWIVAAVAGVALLMGALVGRA